MKILDTGFLIDLQREWVRHAPGPAHEYLGRHTEEEFGISVISVTEFLEGYEDPRDGERFLEPFVILPVDGPVARTAARIRRRLRAQGNPIRDFDVMIAAAALELGSELVTSNPRHFRRVEGLAVSDYDFP